jgi:RNA polymerase sigma-70 factor (ECF subfamily)
MGIPAGVNISPLDPVVPFGGAQEKRGGQVLQGLAEAEELDERALLLRCQRGDRSSFDPIVVRYMRRATAFALGWTGNQEDALDLSQEAFARAFRSIRSFDASRPFYPWYHRILKNLCLDHLARPARRHEVPLVDVAELPGSEARPEHYAEREELRRQVWEAMQQLEANHREILILREFQQLSYAELAAVLEIRRGTVMSRLHEARRRLRVVLEPVLSKERIAGV